jgi:hypothetical protein
MIRKGPAATVLTCISPKTLYCGLFAPQTIIGCMRIEFLLATGTGESEFDMAPAWSSRNGETETPNVQDAQV